MFFVIKTNRTLLNLLSTLHRGDIATVSAIVTVVLVGCEGYLCIVSLLNALLKASLKSCYSSVEFFVRQIFNKLNSVRPSLAYQTNTLSAMLSSVFVDDRNTLGRHFMVYAEMTRAKLLPAVSTNTYAYCAACYA